MKKHQYPFFLDGEEYFTRPEQKHLDAFLRVEPAVEKIYINAKGDRREVVRVDLPFCLVTSETKRVKEYDDQHWWCQTPRADLRDSKVGRVIYVGPAGLVETSSTEWLEWLGKEFTTEDVVKVDRSIPPPPGIVRAMAAARVVSMAEVDKERTGDEEKAHWVPIASRKRG
jgi:hypothetical protein